MKYSNLTITGKRDGFGCQYNAVLSGMALCHQNRKYRYVHTPFFQVSHGYQSPEKTSLVNKITGIPDGRHGKKIHISRKYIRRVFHNTPYYYSQSFRDVVRNYYWKNKTCVNVDIVVHIRRGDIHTGDRLINDKISKHPRYQSNKYYNKLIPSIVKNYPDHYTIAIHSEGDLSDFTGITDGWPENISERVIWKIGRNGDAQCKFDMLSAFHEMVCAKVLIQSKSGLSFVAGVLNTSDNVYFMPNSVSMGQKKPLENWKIIT